MTTRQREHARLEKELQGLQREREGRDKEDNHDVYAEKWDADICHWRGRIKGPLDTPYEGGVFILDIIIPSDYPYNPPKINFITKVWHPNVSSQTGAICLDILKHEWSPALSIRTALLSIQAMLADPVPTDPQDAEVARMLIENPELFNKTARHWTETFAMNPTESHEDKVSPHLLLLLRLRVYAQIKKLTDMGFDKETALTALKNNQWEITSALNSLLG